MSETEHNPIESKLNKILSNQKEVNNNLPGCITYLTIFVGAFAAVKSCSNTEDIMKRYGPLSSVRVENVIGNSAPEEFVELNGQRFYLSIDGKPVHNYVKNR
ncbi:MAG: hypothetical protein AABX96_02735 [Nanoarchaeota archaeon]